jgi:brefeldin A-inhibited guanine nucleotide-exchange protein
MPSSISLSGFRLPGEAQKIDRMMEKFAERYYIKNTSKFDNSDAVFTLGFSIILLNTDLHNPNIDPEKKMKKSDFIRNNKGINGGGNFDIEFQHRIFDRIAQNPISLREDDKAREKMSRQKSTGGLFGGNTKLKQQQEVTRTWIL